MATAIKSKIESIKEMICIVLMIIAIIIFVIIAITGLMFSIFKGIVNLVRFRNLKFENDCDKYDSCINHEDCKDCIDYSRYISSEDIR